MFMSQTGIKQAKGAGGAVASPELLPSKVVGEDQVSEEVLKGKDPLLLCPIQLHLAMPSQSGACMAS